MSKPNLNKQKKTNKQSKTQYATLKEGAIQKRYEQMGGSNVLTTKGKYRTSSNAFKNVHVSDGGNITYRNDAGLTLKQAKALNRQLDTEGSAVNNFNRYVDLVNTIRALGEELGDTEAMNYQPEVTAGEFEYQDEDSWAEDFASAEDMLSEMLERQTDYLTQVTDGNDELENIINRAISQGENLLDSAVTETFNLGEVKHEINKVKTAIATVRKVIKFMAKL